MQQQQQQGNNSVTVFASPRASYASPRGSSPPASSVHPINLSPLEHLSLSPHNAQQQDMTNELITLRAYKCQAERENASLRQQVLRQQEELSTLQQQSNSLESKMNVLQVELNSWIQSTQLSQHTQQVLQQKNSELLKEVHTLKDIESARQIVSTQIIAKEEVRRIVTINQLAVLCVADVSCLHVLHGMYLGDCVLDSCSEISI